MSRQVATVATPLGITLHDHINVGNEGHANLKTLKQF
jgi:DNA repair protein RadC